MYTHVFYVWSEMIPRTNSRFLLLHNTLIWLEKTTHKKEFEFTTLIVFIFLKRNKDVNSNRPRHNKTETSMLLVYALTFPSINPANTKVWCYKECWYTKYDELENKLYYRL